MKRTRVKCANCGMIYDRIETSIGDVVWSQLNCLNPQCCSNAYDILPNQPEHINDEFVKAIKTTIGILDIPDAEPWAITHCQMLRNVLKKIGEDKQ